MSRSKTCYPRLGSGEGYPGGDKENEDEDVDIEEYESRCMPRVSLLREMGQWMTDSVSSFDIYPLFLWLHDPCAKSGLGLSSLTRLLDLLARLRLSCSLAHWWVVHHERARWLQNTLEQKMATTEMVQDGLCGCRGQSRTRIQRTRKAGGLTFFFHTCVQCEAQRKLVGVLFTHWKVEMETCLPLSVKEKKSGKKQAGIPCCFPFIFHLPLHWVTRCADDVQSTIGGCSGCVRNGPARP